jgi:uncharacterized protein
MVEHDKEVITTIIKRYLPTALIYLFGSRARKDHSATSDFDIAIDAMKKIDELTLSAIRDGIEESTIPFKVDIIDLHAITDDFKKKILTEGKLWS